MFHLLVADFVANWKIPDQRARIGRMFEHRRMAGAPLQIRDKHNPSPLEADLQYLVANFADLQRDRYEADYNVERMWTRTDVLKALDMADQLFAIWRRIRKEKAAQDHLLSMFGARS